MKKKGKTWRDKEKESRGGTAMARYSKFVQSSQNEESLKKLQVGETAKHICNFYNDMEEDKSNKKMINSPTKEYGMAENFSTEIIRKSGDQPPYVQGSVSLREKQGKMFACFPSKAFHEIDSSGVV
jgi:hypothetical protein